jgi:hypothetical protein
MVLCFCGIILLSPLMAKYFFGQPCLRGLIIVRKNFFWLSFFMFILLIRDLNAIDKLLKVLTILVGMYVVILLVTKQFPGLGLIHFPEMFYGYSERESYVRFGEYRLFFPYGSVPVMFYCIALARLLHPSERKSFLPKAELLIFCIIVAYAVVSSLTRGLIYAFVIVTFVALLAAQKRTLRVIAGAFVAVFLLVEVLDVATQTEGGSLIEGTTLGKIIFKSDTDTLRTESQRKLQASMCLTQFARSPLTGVGTLDNSADTSWQDEAHPMYRKDSTRENSMNAIWLNLVHSMYRKYGFFNTTDLGYLKIAAESGLLGVAWLVWYFWYFYRRGRQTLAKVISSGGNPTAEAVCRGLLYFTTYLLISGVTLPHWVYMNGITVLPLSLVLMAITRVSASRMERVVANATIRPAGNCDVTSRKGVSSSGRGYRRQFRRPQTNSEELPHFRRKRQRTIDE